MPRFRPGARRVLTPLVFLLALRTAAAAPPLRWQPEPAPAGGVRALATAPGPGRLAAADAHGVWVGTGAGALVLRARISGVRDLAFAEDGALWIGGDEGLWRLRPDGVLEPQGPGIGADARQVRRIRRAGEHWLVATAAGVQRGDASGAWTALGVGFPSGAASALAAAQGPGRALRVGAVLEGVACWWSGPAERVGPGSPLPRCGGSRAEGAGSAAADVALASGSGEAFTLLRDGCVVGPRRACALLPPGAEALRLFEVGGRWWLATDRGLLAAGSALGPWQREAEPLGSLRVHAMAGLPGAWLAASDRGLYAGRADPVAPSVPPGTGRPADLLREWNEPGIEQVRVAVLTYLDLTPSRLRRMRRGAQRRGWLPTLSLRVDHDRSFRRSDDFDEAFVSGGLRSLVDRADDRSRGIDASVELEWDLGDVLHHPESVDVSREVRELLELRDDVLDEVRHLYFERRRTLLELLALAPGQPLEAARLRLRADELAAGIDAWTGGWFGRRALRFSR